MSLLKKASIITTPTAYAEDFLYNIKPAGGLGDELVTNGTFDTDSNWNKTGTWTISNNSATADANSTSQYLQQDFTITNGKIYEFNYVILQNTLNGNGAALSSFGGFGTVAISNEIGQHKTFITAANSSAAYVLKIGVSSTCTTGTIIIDNVSVKEVVDFSFDRNSTGTRVNEDYLIEDVPYNLLRHSESILSTTNWSIVGATTEIGYSDPQGTLNAVKVTPTGNDPYVYGNIQNLSYKTYTGSIYVKGSAAADGLSIRLWLIRDNVEFPFEDFTLTTEWQRLEITKTFNIAITTLAYLRIDSPNSNPPLTGIETFLWGGQVVAGSNNKDYLKTTDRLDIPRIDYTNGEPSILLEPSRTNNVTNSNSSFTTNKTTITYNNINSPEGIQNAFKVECTSSGTAVFARTDSISFTDATFSLFVKYGNTQYLQFLTTNTGAHFFNFDVKNGVFGTNGSNTSNLKAVEYPNGWYRVSGYFTGGSGTGSFRVYLSNSNSAAYGAASATSGDFLYSYGWQVENGSYPTSLIHTSGSTVTRSADRADNAGNSDLINSTEGVFYLQFAALTGAGAFDDLSISDGTQNNKVQLFYRATDKINARVTVGGVNVFDHIYQSTDMTQFEKVAIKWKLNDFSMYVDGREVNFDSSGATFSANTLNVVKINDNNISDYVGKIKCLAVFKEALTDLELEKLTGYNNHELYMNYYNRLSYLGLVEEYNVESDINNYIL